MKKLLSLMCSLLMIVTLCGCSSTQDQQEEVTLTFAAAASLENTFEDKLIPEFEKENPNIKVQGVYDSSGKLQIQIEQGLKADVFFSAATKQMDALVDEKYINKKDVVDLLENKLVLITGKQTTTEVKGFADIAKADLLIIMSDIDGLYDKDPHTYEDAKLIPVVHEITDETKALAGGAGTKLGTGGMITKLNAVEIAYKSDIDVVLMNGQHPKTLYDLFDGKSVGTIFSKNED